MTAGFGLEKLGLVTLKFPRATLLVVLVATAVFVYGGTKLGFSSDIREIFRSGSPDFATLEEVGRQYPGSDRDILMVVEGPNLFERDQLEVIRDLHLELGLVEGIDNVMSMFTARKPPGKDRQTASLFPFEFEDTTDFADLRKRVHAHPLVDDKLLSGDDQLALLVMSLKNPEQDVTELRQQIDEIRKIAEEILTDSGLTVRLTGTSVLRVEIIGALIRDQKTFRMAGLTVAVLLCWLFFRSFAYVVIALAPAGVAIFGLRGAMGLAGQDINVLTNIIPALVMVVAFASALHLLFLIRRRLGRGIDLEEAIAGAVNDVGPACVLTSATTALALLSLTLVPHPFITSFGLTAALGTAWAFVAIMITVPPLSRLLLGRFGPGGASWGKSDRIHAANEALSRAAARLVRRVPGPITAASVVIAIVAGALYAQNTPRYQYQDNLPKANPAYQAIEDINARLSGINSIRLLIQWPKGQSLDTPETLDVIRAAHEIMEGEPALNGVSSLYNFERWFVSGGLPREELFTFLEETPTPLSKRLIAPAHASALVTGTFRSIPATELVAIVDGLKAKLDALGKRYPDVSFGLTGLVPVSAKASTEMIAQLNTSLLIAVCVIILLIGLAFRSVTAGLVSILPNLLPILVVGAGLFLLDKGLQFTSVVAFTIGFGIAVDSTIHVLNRYRLESRANVDSDTALDLTITAIGPVLIVSTLVLISGVGGTILSELPIVRLYGEVIVILLSTALIGAMLVLPALLRVLASWGVRSVAGVPVPSGEAPSSGERKASGEAD